jgi:hypothetical protein
MVSIVSARMRTSMRSMYLPWTVTTESS